jgi:hypothetical protein
MAVPQLANGGGTRVGGTRTGITGTSTTMTTTLTSTANAVNNTTSTKTSSSGFDAQVQELSSPPPQSFTLVATLQLLDPFDTRTDVFLMTRSYLQNWLIWAYHQQVSKNETSRVDAALRLAAERYGLKAPQTVDIDEFAYADPGPIDVCMLSIEGHDLLLRPNVVIKEGEPHTRTTISTQPDQDRLDHEFPELLRRVKSLPTGEDGNSKGMNGAGTAAKGDSGPCDASSAGPEDDDNNNNDYDSLNVDGENLLCCAVPERFYEVSV